MSLFPYLFDKANVDALHARAFAAQARVRKIGQDNSRFDVIERQVCELALLCRSLLQLLQDKGVFDKAELMGTMNAIDAEDGVVDGQVTPPRKRPGTKQAKLAALARKRRSN
jgi:hypothetical protein